MKLKEELSEKKCLLEKKEQEKDELKNDINEQKQLIEEKNYKNNAYQDKREI